MNSPWIGEVSLPRLGCISTTSHSPVGWVSNRGGWKKKDAASSQCLRGGEPQESESRVWLFKTSWTIPWGSPGQNTGVGNLSLLQGIFPTQGSNPGLPRWRQLLYQLSHKGSPRILEWVGYPFSSGSSWLRNWTGVSCIAGRFFTNWAINLGNLLETLGGGTVLLEPAKGKKKREKRRQFEGKKY